MKKLIFAVMMLSGVLLTAQHEGHRKQRGQMKDMTPEQVATLKTKQLTLALDLSQAQQKEIQKLNLEQAQLRQAKRSAREEEKSGETKTQPNKEERYEQHVARLDQMIAHKAKMKSVLNAEQYEKWEKMHMHRQKQRRPKRSGHHRNGR